MSIEDTSIKTQTRKSEIWLFLFLSAVLIPVVTFFLVAGYGFSIWMYQILTGPPTS